LLELAAFHGVRAAGAASGTTLTRSFGGLGTFITANEVAAGGQITKQDIDTLARYIFTDGGKCDLLVMNPEPAEDLHKLYENSSYLRVGLDEGAKLGMNPITRIVTQFGTFQLIVDRWCPLATAWAIDSSKTGYYTLRPFGWKPLAVTGDSKKAELIGEFSFLLANGAGQGWISGIT
jgi:hypothetical protein